MDRTDVYPSEQPTDTIWLTAERNKMIAIGYLAQGMLGTSTVVDGLGCVPTVPPSLAVNILPGSIYQQEPVDTVGFGSLGADVVDQIIKQGIILPITSLTLTPPITGGQAVNYLIQAQILEQDTGLTVLSYFNSDNPAIPLTGPGGSGTSQPTIRQCTVALVAKSGVAATAGTQVTPAPDAGYVGLWVVTVANGATELTSTQIVQYPTAPFISVKLPQVPGWVQGGTYAWANDIGTANQIIVILNPVPANIQAGFEIRVKKMASASTGGMTIVVNGASAIAVVNADGSALTSSTPMNGGFLARLVFDGTSFRWTNTATSTAVGSLGASSGEGINVSGGGVVSLNFPSLTVNPSVANTDLFAYYSQADTHHRDLSWAQLQALFLALTPGRILNIQIISATGTYTKTAGTTRAIVIGTGAGGAGAGGVYTVSWGGGGGGAGATGLAYVNLAAVTTVPCTIGVGGLPVDTGNGADGTDTVFGTYFTAKGGKGSHTAILSAISAPGGVCVVGGTAMLAFLPMGGNAGSNFGIGLGGTSFGVGGTGGNSFWGGGGAGWSGIQGFIAGSTAFPSYPFTETGPVPNGQAGQAPGAGGGGISNAPNVAGVPGAGASGTIVILELA